MPVQENENLHKRLAAAEAARHAAMREMKDVADQCEAAKQAAVRLEESESSLRARVAELEANPGAAGVHIPTHTMCGHSLHHLAYRTSTDHCFSVSEFPGLARTFFGAVGSGSLSCVVQHFVLLPWSR